MIRSPETAAFPNDQSLKLLARPCLEEEEGRNINKEEQKNRKFESEYVEAALAWELRKETGKDGREVHRKRISFAVDL